jgi:hypothetical protein
MVVQARAGLQYAPVTPALDAVLYTITSNTSVDGLYLYAKLPFTTVPTVPPPDAGTGTDATAPTDATASEAGAADGGGSDTGASDAGSGDTGSTDGGATDASSGG